MSNGKMSADEYQQLALRTESTTPFVKNDQQLSRIVHGAVGAATEVGELQDMLKKHLIYNKPIDLVNVMEEIGDVLWYCALTLDAAGFTMSQAMDANIAKLKKRFGDKFTEEAANNRDLSAERSVLEEKSVKP